RPALILSAACDLWSDPAVTHYMGGPRERDWLRTEFEEDGRNPAAEQYDLWPVIEKGSGQLVGNCGLLEKEVGGEAEIELVYVFAASAWGKGYATEIGMALIRHAFETLGLERLIALIEPENAASERVAQKVGMRFDREVRRPGGAIRKVYVIESGE
ncbi:MAG: GNAT family N-acetyltransferase, partial [Anaerolineales bacterium]